MSKPDIAELLTGTFSRGVPTAAGGFVTKGPVGFSSGPKKTGAQLEADERGREFEAAYARGDVSEEVWQARLDDARNGDID